MTFLVIIVFVLCFFVPTINMSLLFSQLCFGSRDPELYEKIEVPELHLEEIEVTEQSCSALRFTLTTAQCMQVSK